MLYDLSGFLPLFVVIAVLGLAGAVISLAVLARIAVDRQHMRVARQQGIPANYRRLVPTH